MGKKSQSKRYVAIPQTVIAYDQIIKCLKDFSQGHQDDNNLVAQVKLLQDYAILLQKHDAMFEHLMLCKQYENARICLFCQNAHLAQAVTLADKIVELADDFDEKILLTLEFAFWETDRIINIIGQQLEE